MEKTSGTAISLRRLRVAPLVRALGLVLLVAVLAGCGRNGWPEPQMNEDRFRWRNVTAHRAGNCAVVDCELAGAWKNVESVRVMLEPIGTGPDDGCASCPFVPRITRVYSMSSAEVQRDMNRLVITTCGLTPGKTYRVRVLLNNVYTTFQPVISSPMFVTPQKEHP